MIHSALSGHYSAFDDEDRLCGWWIRRKLEKLPDRVISTLDDDGVKENNLPDCPRALGELDAMKPEASRLIQAIADGMRPGGDLVRELLALGDDNVSTAEEATIICDTVAVLLARTFHHHDDSACAAFPVLLGLFESIVCQEAMHVMQEKGLPLLYAAFDHALSCERLDADDLLLILKVFAIHGTRDGAERIVRAAQLGIASQRTMWSVILEQFDEEHPQSVFMINRLKDSLLLGTLGIAYLQRANRLAAVGAIQRHPFDTDARCRQMTAWLRDADHLRHLQAAIAVAASLPYLDQTRGRDLLALALDHHSPCVQIEAAVSTIRLGNLSARKLLIRWCNDPRYSRIAMRSLRFLGWGDAVPAGCCHPDFLATADLCQWLSQPNEYGRPPDRIELMDTRVLYWPPTDDLRQVWLFSYYYDDHECSGGVGMVGSVTCSLIGETTSDLPAADVYALHCCCELQNNGDRRAPRYRSVKAGKTLVDRYNRSM
jgi:hypothetical protein